MFDRELTPEQQERHRLVENRAWLNENFPSLQDNYADQWIAVLDQQVVVHDQKVDAVKSAVGERYGEAVIMRIPKDSIPSPI
jgi:hypothetical protein